MNRDNVELAKAIQYEKDKVVTRGCLGCLAFFSLAILLYFVGAGWIIWALFGGPKQ